MGDRRPSRILSLASYTHDHRKVGVVELSCEREETRSSTTLAKLGEQLAMHVVAMNPRYLDLDAVDPEVREREVALAEGMGRHGRDARVDAALSILCLMEQDCVFEPGLRVREVLQRSSDEVGERIGITRFWRIESAS